MLESCFSTGVPLRFSARNLPPPLPCTSLWCRMHTNELLLRMQIDLDTIETSNLNRQFLFRKRHVGQSKSAVAAEAVRRFAPNTTIQPHQVCSSHAATD